jgi:hypothetical protein
MRLHERVDHRLALPHRAQDVDEHRAERGQEELGDEILVVRVEADRPRANGEHGEDVADDIEPRPRAACSQVHRSGDQDRLVAEERDLCISSSWQEKRRDETAADADERQTLRSVTIREHRRHGRDAEQQREGGRAINQVVEVVGREDRDVLDRGTTAGQNLSIKTVPLAKA